MPAFVVHAFYKFVPLPDFRELRPNLRAACLEHDLVGTILLAPEGINATIAGVENQMAAFWNHLCQDPRFSNIQPRITTSEIRPFLRMKVRLKKEIITMGVHGIDPTREAGIYVKPEDWNDLVSRPDVCLVDTRNEYEVAEGTFRGALNPRTRSFREFPNYADRHLDPEKQPHIAMYCTGGIRCEKATAYLLKTGFKNVYHLQGGILNYLETVPEEESLWKGKCFVFDERETLGHDLTSHD